MQTLLDLSKFASVLPASMRAAERQGTLAAGRYVTKGIRQEIRQDSGGDMRLSGLRGSKRVGADTDIRTLRGTTIVIKAIGPVHFMEFGTKPHRIYPRKRRALKWGSQYAAYVNHPGTRPKHTFSRGVNKTRPMIGEIFDETVQREIRKVL